MEVINKGNIGRIYHSFVDEYEFDMEAYAEVAQHIVQQNVGNLTAIGELMMILEGIYQTGNY